MPVLNAQETIDAALELLPAAGTEVEFDQYKAQLYAAHPDAGRDAFATMLKTDQLKKRVVRGEDGKPKVMLSRK